MLAANSNSDEDEILCRCWQYNTGRQSVSGEGMNDGAVTVKDRRCVVLTYLWSPKSDVMAESDTFHGGHAKLVFAPFRPFSRFFCPQVNFITILSVKLTR